MNVQRPLIEQTFFNVTVAVGTTPTPLASQLQAPSMIQAFILSNPSTNANSIFLGDQNVSLTTGIEIVVGVPILLAVLQDRQQYETQDPMLLMAQMMGCSKIDPIAIPVLVLNPSNIFLIASVATNVAAMLFRNVYT